MTPTAEQLIDGLRPMECCFSSEEFTKLRAALALIPSLNPVHTEQITTTMGQAAKSLPQVADVIASSPSFISRQRIGGRERDAETLVNRLCSSDQLCIEFSMPTSALLARSFLLAKVNFLKSVAYSLEDSGPEGEAAREALQDLVGEAIFLKLAEELLTALVSNPLNALPIRHCAARKLVSIWDENIRLPVDRLPSVLLSAWRARGKVRAIYGTLIGVNEVFSLVQAQCQSRFVNYFVRDHVTADEREAFREFLFAISYEDLEQLQRYMEEHGLTVISPEQVKEVVSTPMHPVIPGDADAEQMYSSYCRRRIRADYRAISDVPGPRKTAEGYMMESLLREECAAEEPSARDADA
jgi:hypothetical protein